MERLEVILWVWHGGYKAGSEGCILIIPKALSDVNNSVLEVDVGNICPYIYSAYFSRYLHT